jgi:hypothetical protein
MPEFGRDFRTQILVGLKAEGVGEADKIRQEMERLRGIMKGIQDVFATGEVAFRDYLTTFKDVEGEYNRFAKVLVQVEAAEQAEIDAQARLISSVGAWASAIREGSRAASDHNQQLADMARLQEHLAGMEARTHRERGDEALRQQQLRDTVEQAEATREAIRLQQALGAMETRTARDAAEATALRGQSTRAAMDQVRQQEADERQGLEELARLRQHLGQMDAKAARDEAEAATLRGQSTRSAIEQLHQHQADERLMAQLVGEEAQAGRDLAQVRAKLGEMEARDSREQGERLDFVNRIHAAMSDNEKRRLAEEEQAATRRGAAIEKHTADVAKSSDEINVLLAKETAATEAAEGRKAQARAQAEAQHDAEMSKAEERHTKIMGQAEEEAAIYAQRVADRRAARAAQDEVDALQRIGAQGQSNIELYKILEAQMAALIAKGSTRTNDDFDAMDRLKVKMREVWADMKVGAPAVRQITDDLAQQNTVINAGAAYTQQHAGSWHGFSDEVRTAQMAIKGTNDATQQSSAAMGRFGYGLLNVAHAAQDAQYGLGAVLNNIPLVTQSIVQAIPALERFSQKIGGPMGLAGAAMLLAVAANSIYNNFDKIKVAFVGGTPFGPLADDVEKLTHRVEELDGAWLQSIEDVHAAAQAHRDLKNAAEAAKIAATPTEEQEKRKKSFQEAVKETPGGAQAAQNVARELEASRFFADPAGAVRAALESGRMPIRADLGITPERIGRTITDDRMYAIIKEQYFDKVIPALANQAIADMGRGEAPAFKDLMGRAMQHQRLGERDEAGNLINTFLRKLEQTSPEAQKKAEEIGQELEALDSEIEEGNRQWREYRERRKRTVATHATAFGTKKAMGDKLEGDVRKLIAEGEEDPEKLKAGILADVERRIEAAKTVPPALIKDVRDKVAERYVRKVLDEMESNVAEGQSITEAAKAAIAAAVAKEKAKEEKPEIAHEVARMGQADRENIREAILVDATKKLSDEAIRKWLVPKVRKRAEEAGVEPEVSPEVAAKLVDEELGKIRAQQAARGGVKPATARELLGEQRVKFAGQDQARERRAEQAQGVAVRPAMARQIFAEFGGNVSPEQATEGAEQLQRLVKSGENPARAQAMVVAHMLEFVRENIATTAQVSGMNEQMAIVLQQATMQLAAMRARISMTEGRMKVQRWQQPPPWNTIGGG